MSKKEVSRFSMSGFYPANQNN